MMGKEEERWGGEDRGERQDREKGLRGRRCERERIEGEKMGRGRIGEGDDRES